MARSKVILNGTTLMDVTQDTVNSSNLMAGFTAHNNAGQQITGAATGMEIHICSASEYDSTTGVPTIQDPESNTFYLVPGGSASNLYVEWIYINNAWEIFGSASIDLSGYAELTDLAAVATSGDYDDLTNKPTLGKFITEGTGDESEIFNDTTNNVASGDYSHAEGYNTKASGSNQHVQGKYNVEDTNNTYAHIVGGGLSDNARENIHTIDWSGNAYFKGAVTASNLYTKTEIDTMIGNIETLLASI